MDASVDSCQDTRQGGEDKFGHGRPPPAISPRPEPNPCPDAAAVGMSPRRACWGRPLLRRMGPGSPRPAHARGHSPGPGGGCGGPASRVFVTPLHTEHPHPRRQNKGTPEKEAPLHTQGVPRARRRTLACGRLSREVGAPRMRAPRGCRRPEDAGAVGRAPGKPRDNAAHTSPGPQKSTLGLHAGPRRKAWETAGQRAGRGGHPKRSREGEEDGRTEAQLRGSCTL